jgi:hypothetical protein
VNRPALAHTIFRGRFAQFSSRHHQHFLSIIVVGFIGPLFWPYAYDDFLNYTFYPYAYDAFWPGAYDDVYDGITGVYGAGRIRNWAPSATQCRGQQRPLWRPDRGCDGLAHQRDCADCRAG